MPEFSYPFLLLPCFFLIAALYSSVGHGGASGYLAILALFGIANPSASSIVLCINIAVAGVSFVNYYCKGFFRVRLLLPFAIAGFPSAFLGGFLHVSPTIFSFLLGFALVLSGVRIIFFRNNQAQSAVVSTRKIWFVGIPLGAVLGFVSGMIGIGGGVFLSPILLFLAWANVKETAAISSAFIVLNSLGGLIGHLSTMTFPFSDALFLAVFAISGGILGSRLGAGRTTPFRLQLALSAVLLIAGAKMIAKALF